MSSRSQTTLWRNQKVERNKPSEGKDDQNILYEKNLNKNTANKKERMLLFRNDQPALIDHLRKSSACWWFLATQEPLGKGLRSGIEICHLLENESGVSRKRSHNPKYFGKTNSFPSVECAKREVASKDRKLSNDNGSAPANTTEINYASWDWNGCPQFWPQQVSCWDDNRENLKHRSLNFIKIQW